MLSCFQLFTNNSFLGTLKWYNENILTHVTYFYFKHVANNVSTVLKDLVILVYRFNPTTDPLFFALQQPAHHLPTSQGQLVPLCSIKYLSNCFYLFPVWSEVMKVFTFLKHCKISQFRHYPLDDKAFGANYLLQPSQLDASSRRWQQAIFFQS